VEKESKILSGKSLMTISRLVPEGLTLAVHLDLPDSTITGLGFDAISNGLGMVDVTYKILLYWKRQQRDKKDGAVNNLSAALRDMGREDIATVIAERHRENKDVTLECFVRSWYRSASLYDLNSNSNSVHQLCIYYHLFVRFTCSFQVHKKFVTGNLK